MSARFIHTSDWHIGKAFASFDGETAALLRDARLSRISQLGDLAREHGIGHVLVAGDVYDVEEPSLRTLQQPMEQMREHPGIRWHIIPGNHDPHRPNGLWDRLLRKGIPGNVQVHLQAGAVPLEEGRSVLLPAPLRRRRSHEDPTAYMDEEPAVPGLIRVGLAHGSVAQEFSSRSAVSNHIDPQRCESAGLSYLALGDWHGQKRVGPRCWYSGSFETCEFGEENSGEALLVEIANPGALPEVTSLATGRYRWIAHSARLMNRADVEALATQLRGLHKEKDRVLLKLEVEGMLSLEDIQFFQERIVEVFPSVFRSVRLDQSRLLPQASDADLDRINRVGFVRDAAQSLRDMAGDERSDQRELAAEALKKLYLEYRKLQVPPT